MRTTLNLDEGTYGRAKRWAERDGASFSQWVAELIEREDTRRRCEAHAEWLAGNPDVAGQLDDQDAVADRRLAEGARGAA
ncbi:hypothetical protein [Haloactinomyces albus]|uniref:Uncharacterized protein n=1 Tax=Haloactinomyces albus TaxID=1352928 RepID=A0AAE3ZI57_9ACTN|nr:hypothetical protein [Haloactinomyces albus]MDR7304028.1 hypothetical protein [Haloactinomyces albus]